MAPYIEDFPYEELRMINKGAEGRVFEVKRKSDGKIFAAKMRFNPKLRIELMDDY